MEVGSLLQHDMIPHDTVSATMDAWLPGAGIAVWDWIPFLSHEASTHKYFSLHIIVQLSGSESKVQVFQVSLPTRVKAHVSAFARSAQKAPCSSFSRCDMLSMHMQNTALSISKEKSMEHHSPPITQEAKTTIADVVRWAHELARLHARIAPHFARPEPRRRALAYPASAS
jgi:hypothetical protein